MIPSASMAQTVIGSWLSAPIPPSPANDEGWQRGQGGFGPNGSIFASSNSPAFFELKAGVAAGYAQSLDIHETGFGNVRLFIDLTPAQIAAFTNNSQLKFTMSCDSSASSGSTAGYIQMVQFQCNSSGGGFQSPGINTAGGFSETGDTNNNSNGQPIFFFSNGSLARQQVVTWDYSSLKPAINGSTYAQFVFIFQVGGGAPTNIYINNITLSTPATQTTYIVDDFSTNGVGPTNPTNHDFYASSQFTYSNPGDIANVWMEWFGNGAPAFSWVPNVDANGDTNSGAIAVQLNWNGFATDGFQQWVMYHGGGQNTYVPVPGGTVGIGFPQYTNVECDVRFDASSANLTNANFANGVYGVLRLGIRPAGAGTQDWQPQANYTTITDTNWHHMTMQLTGSNPDFGNIGDVILGEDVTSYVDGTVGLTGQQTLYVDNIRFTGPLVAAKIPPPTLSAPQPAKPGLRVFAGSTANTYDRQQLVTVDANQSWADPGVTYPVKYSYSLQSYNPNITQVHLELTPGGNVTQYTDYVGNNLLWMVLSPGANGQVVCNLQWKTNAPNSNPGGTVNSYGNALTFTNSTAIGTWSLVFTGTNAGYVIAPGQVILGQTNFTIADTNVVTDFANPMQAVFGIQPNTTAGQGQYIDYGTFQITGVVGANEFEDFTTESSDISGNLTPSGQFNNNSSFLAASTIIVTTNDALWMNWTQPAVGFTLATATNLTNPNWINPGWYGGYADTNAPRVMPLAQPFAGKFWVLLPKDDLPTANGQQNSTPPAAGPRAPNAFFILSTNVVSP